MTWAELLLDKIRRKIDEAGNVWAEMSDAFWRTQVEDRREVRAAVKRRIRKLLAENPDARLADVQARVLEAVGARTCGPCEGFGTLERGSVTCPKCHGTGGRRKKVRRS